MKVETGDKQHSVAAKYLLQIADDDEQCADALLHTLCLHSCSPFLK